MHRLSHLIYTHIAPCSSEKCHTFWRWCYFLGTPGWCFICYWVDDAVPPLLGLDPRGQENSANRSMETQVLRRSFTRWACSFFGGTKHNRLCIGFPAALFVVTFTRFFEKDWISGTWSENVYYVELWWEEVAKRIVTVVTFIWPGLRWRKLYAAYAFTWIGPSLWPWRREWWPSPGTWNWELSARPKEPRSSYVCSYFSERKIQ